MPGESSTGRRIKLKMEGSEYSQRHVDVLLTWRFLVEQSDDPDERAGVQTGVQRGYFP
jgi:hypothetical protein